MGDWRCAKCGIASALPPRDLYHVVTRTVTDPADGETGPMTSFCGPVHPPTLAAEVSRLEGEVAALRGLLHMWLTWCDAVDAPGVSEHVRQGLFDKAHDASRAKLAEGGRDG